MTSNHPRASFSTSSTALLALPYSVKSADSVNFDLSTANQGAYTVADPSYLSSQLKSAEWLHRYGLKSQKLTFDQILQQIGFKRVESYSNAVGKTVGAKYAGNLYQEVQNDNGDRYVLTCRPEKLREFRNRLERLLNLLQKRLTFITSGSRRFFGIIGEPSVCLVCDCKATDRRVFNQFQQAVVSLLREQISKIKRFNIIWVGNDSVQYQEKPIDSTSISIDEAIEWINNRKQTRAKVSISATCEAILKAFSNTVHSIYLITEGTSSDSAREMLRDNIVKTRLSSTAPIPLHVAALFCSNNDTETFLRSIAQTADGSYYSYKIQSELTNYQSTANHLNPTKIKLQENKLQFGTSVEQGNDVSLMYKEINQCRNVIDRLEKILGIVKDDNQALGVYDPSNKLSKSEPNLQRSLVIQSSALFNHDENDMASIDWLKIYGVNAQKLDFHTVIQPAAFRHCDGIVTLHQSPEQTNTKQTPPAISTEKLINAKYCDQFAHVTWTDGTIRHVYVTPELHRDYERRMRALIEKVKARLSWLKKGSRDVFGTILEKNIYILIDTSKSMENHLEFVKDKLRLLVQDQLFSKERVNMASFNTIVNPWRDRLTKITSSSTQSELQSWIDTLYTEGSTNTLAALRFALADSGTEAIYLLTDGRPDQNERHILSQVQYRQMVPTHTIAFNIQDQTANQFLFDLAKQTGGRFHAFNYGLENSSSIEIPESEDISYLKKEIIYAEKELQQVADLRDECLSRSWSRDNLPSKPRISLANEYLTRSQSTLELPSQSNEVSMPKRSEGKKRTATSLHRRSTVEKTSILNLNPDQWLLPETEEYLKSNQKRLKSFSTVEYEETEPVKLAPSSTVVKTAFDEVKSYLKKNSLVSKGLTIFDVLQPTSITIKEPQHIQVIDRYVLSKVWDDILPLAYGSYANKLRLVNQYAVNLDRYETRLKELIEDYYQFTSRFVWKHISDEEKRKLAPRTYWLSLTSEDQNKLTRAITSDEHTDESALELFAWRKLTTAEQEKFLHRPVLYQNKTEVLLKNALKSNETESALHGVNRMDVEIQRAIKFLQISADLRQYQKRADVTSNGSKTPPKRRPSTSIRRFGQRVLCRYDPDGYYYPGTIQKDQHNHAIIFFDMDIEQPIVQHVLIPFDRNPSLNLFLQDAVLVRQENQAEEHWIPGLIVCLPSPYAIPANLYKVYAFDTRERQVFAHRKDLIRINLTLYQRSVMYLKNLAQNMPVIDGYIPQPRPDSSNPLKSEIEAIIREFLKPINKQLEDLTETNNERFNELEQILRDLISATRILQEKASKRKKQKDDDTQTDDLQKYKPPASKTHPPGTIGLACWKDDDGLFYQGKILRSMGARDYQVERSDLPDVCSTIALDDLFIESQLKCLRELNNNKSKQFILMEYPGDTRRCFCPAVVLSFTGESPVKIRFYDCLTRDFSNESRVYSISESQFQEYTTLRIEKEKSIVNQVVVGLHVDEEKGTKSFMLGTVIERIKTGQRYRIEWYNKTKGGQNEEHLFGAFVRRDQHHLEDYVLAIDKTDQLYKFAKIKGISNDEKTLQVQYLPPHPSKTADVPSVTTFVVTKTYYNSMRGDLQS